MRLARFAVDANASRGRYYEEANADFRSPFQRDRDRIVHSTAFRRLANKTQVFVSHEGDLFRSRLTHSLEVAQVARALARRLKLNEDLAESIALSHDLGHPPFGHTGEDTLNALMQPYGGFDHNAQALRIVSYLEERYARFRGLNLTWETLEGMAKHNGPLEAPLPWAMEALVQSWDLEVSTHASLEAQIAAIADDIAYNHHDIQDGLRSGLIVHEQLLDVPVLRQLLLDAEREHPKSTKKIQRYEAFSKFFSSMVNDVYEETLRNLSFAPERVEDIRNHPTQIVRFSDGFYNEMKALRAFLFEKLYRHPEIMEQRELASEMLMKVFNYVFENPEKLPEDWRQDIDLTSNTLRARLASDYVSGMTDNYVSNDWNFVHQLKWTKTPRKS